MIFAETRCKFFYRTKSIMLLFIDAVRPGLIRSHRNNRKACACVKILKSGYKIREVIMPSVFCGFGSVENAA